MKKLTLKEFKAIKFATSFATGVLPNAPNGIFMNNLGGNLRWVARKGRINDWTIYCHWDHNDAEWIAKHGDKVYSEIYIKRCVPCDDEVFESYRF
jgi:hypothetical protein